MEIMIVLQPAHFVVESGTCCITLVYFCERKRKPKILAFEGIWYSHHTIKFSCWQIATCAESSLVFPNPVFFKTEILMLGERVLPRIVKFNIVDSTVPRNCDWCDGTWSNNRSKLRIYVPKFNHKVSERSVLIDACDNSMALFTYEVMV